MQRNDVYPGGQEFFKDNVRFRFRCHSELACFGKCCRDINIFLTPYDVIRLKNFLNVSSTVFLKEYTGQLELPQIRFPFIYLKMSEEEGLPCPFVTARGCSVYSERPWSCRMAPVDIAGQGLYRLAFDESKCHGLNEQEEWTVRDWMSSQEMEIYEKVESSFKEIPRLVRFTGDDDRDSKIAGLFHLVCYDVDAFREFLSVGGAGSVGGAKWLRECADDDISLLQTGIRWLVEIAGNMELPDYNMSFIFKR